MVLQALTVAGMLLAAPAFGGGKVSPPPPPAPKVDFSALPPSADKQAIQQDKKKHPVRARLLFDKDVAKPGGRVRVGVHLTQNPGWHTYWKTPGEIGLPTDIKWTLPKGATAKPYAFPVPQRFVDENVGASYGYNDEVLFFSTVKLPDDLPPGKHVVKAEANWLVCKTTCIPGSAKLELPLTVAANAKPSSFVPLFDHYTKQHPKPAKAAPFTFSGTIAGGAVEPNKPFKITFELTPKGKPLAAPKGKDAWPTFTPILGPNNMVTGATAKGTSGGGIEVVLEGESFEEPPFPKDERIGGLFQVEVDGQPYKTELSIPMAFKAAAATPPPATNTPVATAPETAVLATAAPAPAASQTVGLMMSLPFLVGAFFGGLLLNIMPCVLPVLALKLYGLIECVDIDPREQKMAGVAYTGGILVSFWALAAAVLVLQQAFGMDVGWGFQFQYPGYVAALTVLVFGFGLSLFGVFELPAMGVETASSQGSREGPVGYFMTGVFATLVATPCSAPFMGPALGFAFTAPPLLLILTFTLLGLGLASPFLLIAFVPALYRYLPTPGAWMETFKQAMGFTLVGTAIWLFSVLTAQVGTDRGLGFLWFLGFVSIGAWVFGRWGGVHESGLTQLKAFAAAVVIMGAAGWYFVDLTLDTGPVFADNGPAKKHRDLDFSEEVPWQPFSNEKVAALDGENVFIDFTAEWCLSCKANEKAVIETTTVRKCMDDAKIVPLKADWTKRDPEITEWLTRHGRAGVPFYLVLPKDGSPLALPEVLTTDILTTAFGC